MQENSNKKNIVPFKILDFTAPYAHFEKIFLNPNKIIPDKIKMNTNVTKPDRK